MGNQKKHIKIIILLFVLLTGINVIAAPTWQRVNYTNTTTFLAVVNINAYNSLYTIAPPTVMPGDFIGAFVDGECRMIAEIFEYDGMLYVSSVIHGGDLESMQTGGSAIPELEIEFRLWDESTGSEYDVLGTTFFNQEGEIGTNSNLFNLGAPNTGNALDSLAINGFDMNPAFEPNIVDYYIEIPVGSDMPVNTDYTMSIADSRSSVEILYASDLQNNITEIKISAEDGTTRTYKLQFIEKICTVDALAVSSPQICAGDDIPSFLVDGVSGEIRWYDAADSGTLLHVGAEYHPMEIAPFWVAHYNGCEGPRTKVEISVIHVDPVIIGGHKTICEGSSLPELWVSNASGNVYWYTEAPSTTSVAVAEGETYSPDDNSPGLKEIWAKQNVNTCFSEPVSVSFLVDQKPETPTIELESEIFISDSAIPINYYPQGGVLSGTGVSGNSFDPGLVSPGIYTVNYTVTNGVCSASASTTIHVKEDVILAYDKLHASLLEANSLLSEAVPGANVGNYPQIEIDKLQLAVYEAQNVKDTASVQQTLNRAAENMSTAIEYFRLQLVPDVITGISIYEISKNLLVGDTFIATLLFEPGGATPPNVVWYSQSTSVAIVDSASGLINAKGTGTAKIIVSYNSFADTMLVTVFDKDLPLNFDMLDAEINRANTMINNATVGTSVSNYSLDVFDLLSNTIGYATLIRNSASTQSNIDSVVDSLVSVITIFNESVVKDVVTGIFILSENQTLEIGEHFIPEITFTPNGVTPEQVKWTAISHSDLITLNQLTGEVVALAAGFAEVEVQVVVGANVYSDRLEYTILEEQKKQIEVSNIMLSEYSKIVLMCDEVVSTVSHSMDDFTILINDVAVQIADISINPNDAHQIFITVDHDIFKGDELLLSYENNGNIVTVSGSEIYSISNFSIQNIAYTNTERSSILLSAKVYSIDNTIYVESPIEINRITIFTISGQKLYSEFPSSSTAQMHMEGIPAGLYNVVVYSDYGIEYTTCVLK